MKRKTNLLIALLISLSWFSLDKAVAARPVADTAFSEYVIVKDGHLYLDGERVRYWGAIGSYPGDTYEENEAMVQRLKNLGFNSVRCFNSPGRFAGDPDRIDRLDHFFSCIKKAGMKVWFAGLESGLRITPEDVNVVDDPATAGEWKEAVSQMRRQRALCHVWDERYQQLYINQRNKILNHYNKHTGYRYADDPVFMVWELTNEDWWFFHMKRGEFLNLPEFFQKELYAKWNDYLKSKYGTQVNLKKAWVGNLLENESLDKRNILLLPVLNDITDEQAATLGVQVQSGSVATDLTRDNFNGKRGADVIDFLLKMWIGYKEREAAALKSAGISTKLCPLVWENGIGYDLQTQYMQQHADAISHDSYFNGTFQTDPHHKRFPWVSQLEELPKVSWSDPWLEHNKMEGKPFFVYETQIMDPAKYRAEYPMEIVKLASIQDWDIINWHYWGFAQDPNEEHPYNKKLDYVTRTHYPQGYHYQFDEVQASSMLAAAEIFKNFLLDPAPEPTQFIFGKKSLYSWDMNSYGQTGEAFLPTVYRYGMRLKIDPSRITDTIIGPYIQDRGIYESCPIVPTDQISHDWQKGFLTFDAPEVAMYTGFFAQYGGDVHFGNNVTLKDVEVNNPDGMPYPVTSDEKYIEFCLVSADRKDLDESQKIYVSLVSTSFNSGFKIDEDLHANRPFTPTKEWTWNLNSLTLGHAPVLVARVSATVAAPFLKGMHYRFIDWDYKTIEEGRLKDNVLTIPNDKPVYLVELTK